MTNEPLEPPTIDLTLEPPEPVTVVDAGMASKMVPLDQAALPALDQMVNEYVESVVAPGATTPELTEKADAVRTMGDADIRAAATVSNRILDAPIRAMRKGGFGPGSEVSQTLLELRRQVEDLDPNKTSMSRRIFGRMPFGDKVRDYFHRYESAQTHLNAILRALYEGQDELRKDNATLEQEKVHLWEAMQRLAQYAYVAERLDASLTARIATVEATDRERADTLKRDVLFYVRQKHQDLLTQLAVSIQGYLAIDLVRRNNIELIKGVDRATTSTISALRTAVIVAQALANQRLVLDQITTLNTTTSNLIESTSKVLATQSVAINEQAASSTIGIDKLQAAFTNIYQTMDAIDAFKVQALNSMQTTVNVLETEIKKAQSYLERARDREGNEASSAEGLPELRIPAERR